MITYPRRRLNRQAPSTSSSKQAAEASQDRLRLDLGESLVGRATGQALAEELLQGAGQGASYVQLYISPYSSLGVRLPALLTPDRRLARSVLCQLRRRAADEIFGLGRVDSVEKRPAVAQDRDYVSLSQHDEMVVYRQRAYRRG